MKQQTTKHHAELTETSLTTHADSASNYNW